MELLLQKESGSASLGAKVVLPCLKGCHDDQSEKEIIIFKRECIYKTSCGHFMEEKMKCQQSNKHYSSYDCKKFLGWLVQKFQN
jgi:hypothetical protein